MRNMIGLLALLDAAEGSLETRIRLQKLAYLLAAAGSSQFDLSDFEYHHYGPYSRSLSDALRSAVSSELIQETDLADPDLKYSKYSYSLTDGGRSIAELFADMPQDDINLVKSLKNTDWRALELAATIHYLEKNSAMSRDQALIRAVELKPKTMHAKSDAIGILDGISLC
ncbi:MAG: hypothetical protein ACE360_09620 [Hyphomicrobiales bacterium]